jgi:hypothetical protein
MLARSSRWLRVAAVATATAAGAIIMATGAAQATAAPHVTQVKADTTWGAVHPVSVFAGYQPSDTTWG